MKFKYLLSAILTLGIPGIANADSLLEVYQQALQSDPLIHEAEARRMATFEALPQARSSLFPQLRAGGSWAQGSNTGLQSFQQEISPGVVEFRTVEADSDFDSFGWNAELRQTIFRWDQFVGLKQADQTSSES